MQIDLKIPPKIKPLFKSDKRYNVVYGGRGGSKSWTIAHLLILKSIEKKIFVLATREIQNSIKDSVHKLLCDVIEKLELSFLFDIKKDEIVCLRNGSKFIFKGLHHNIQEIKSTEGIDHCWIEEAHSISQESLDILIPTVRKENSQFWIIFNPDSEDNPVYKEFIKNTRPDSLVIKINYYDNPFFPEVLRKEMEYDKEFNFDKYQHIWEGNIKHLSDACIFKNKFSVMNFNTHENVEFYYGADWGFSNDPTAIVRCYPKDRVLYIDYEAGGVGIELDEIDQLFDSIPGARDNIITGDSSRPDTISYLRRKGFDIRSSIKGKNSIEDGIEFLRSFEKIVIHERCRNTAYEFKSYCYKKDKNTDEILPIIIDANNHWIDSLRYATERLRRGGNVAKSSKVSAYSLGL